MLPTSASLNMSDSTTQTAGPQAAATAPVFSVVHQIGEGNTSNPTSSASAAAGQPTAGGISAATLPTWLLPAALGLAAVVLIALVVGKRKATP